METAPAEYLTFRVLSHNHYSARVSQIVPCLVETNLVPRPKRLANSFPKFLFIALPNAQLNSIKNRVEKPHSAQTLQRQVPITFITSSPYSQGIHNKSICANFSGFVAFATKSTTL